VAVYLPQQEAGDSVAGKLCRGLAVVSLRICKLKSARARNIDVIFTIEAPFGPNLDLVRSMADKYLVYPNHVLCNITTAI